MTTNNEINIIICGVGGQGVVLVSDDVTLASYEAAILAPLGPLDAQSLLEVDDAVDRLERTADLVASEIEILRFRRSG